METKLQLEIKNVLNQFPDQVFLEPKGSNLLEQDKWKQDFLLSLSDNPNLEVLSENEHVRLLGIKFYTDVSDLKDEFREDFKAKLFEN